MKKLFSYLLISSMVVLSSCTNYDDQFDDLNSQINSLKGQIEGFSSLSSGLTALQGTVASLQSAVANIPVTPATDISGLESSLETLAASVAELQTALANAATAAEVAALQTALSSVQTDLDELLASNNVYSTDLVINSAATLDFAKNLGDKLTIVNADVTFIVDDTMSITDVQAVADKLVTVTQNLTYYAKSSAVAAIDFSNLTSTNDLVFVQAGNYNLGKLASAAAVKLGNNYSTKVNVIDLESLTSVSSLNTGSASVSGSTVTFTSTANTIDFNRATNIHLTSLAVYTPGSLTLKGAKDFTLKIDALTSQDAEGEEVGLNLTIDGAAELNNDKLVSGDVNTTGVSTVILKKLTSADAGTVGNAVTLELGALEGDLTVTGSDLETATIVSILDADATTTDKIGGDITLSATSLLSATISGVPDAISFDGATDLEDVTISGSASSIYFNNNSSLTDVSITAAVTGRVTVNNADDLLSLDLQHTVAAGASATAGELVITNNAKLATLKADKINKVKTLTITGNEDLSSISFDALAAINTGTAKPAITIGGTSASAKNNLSASKIEDTVEATGVTAEEGKITTTSGISALKAYLDAAIAASGTVYVAFDTVDLYIEENDTESSNVTTGSKLVVVDFNPGTTVTTSDVRETVSLAIDIAGRNALFAPNSLASNEAISLTALGVTKSYSAASTDINTVSDLVSAIDGDTTWGSGITVTAAQDSYAKSYNKISYTNASGVATSTLSSGNVVWSYGTLTGTLSLSSGDGSNELATALASALNANAAYGAEANTVSGTVIVTKVVTNTSNTNIGPGVTFSGTEKFGFTINASTTVSFGGASSTVGLNSDYFLAVSKTDVNGLRITVKNNSTSIALATAGAVSAAVSNGSALSTTVTSLVSGTTMIPNTSYVAAFSDVVVGSSSTTGDSDVDYTSWL